MFFSLLNPLRFWDPSGHPIEVEASSEDIEALFAAVRRVWSRFAETDAYYSVLAHRRFRGSPPPGMLREFYASGEQDVNVVRQLIEKHGGDPRKIGTVLDVGCGLGRVSYSLARAFPKVVGIDVSPGHLDIARQYMADHGVANFIPICLSGVEDLGQLPRFDLLYSKIVLQHNPPPIIRIILDTLLSKLNRGGFAIFQIPTARLLGYSFSVQRHLKRARRDRRWEMHAFPTQKVQWLADKHGCVVLETIPSLRIALGWRSHTFVLSKS
jgi:2-polyprenyl-3-methyl-5-hydroxy-6-metoxy-1,4-benzoquinol methylase